MKAIKLFLTAIVLLTFLLSCGKKSTEPETTVKAPQFVLPSGTYETGQYISLSCGTDDAEIRYTVDLTEPTVSSPLYSTSLMLPDFFINNANYCTVKAKAFRSDLLPSATASATYTVSYDLLVEAPEINPAGGQYNYCPFTVSIYCPTAGAQIRYTTDGSAPSYVSPIYTGVLSLSTSQTIKAKAFKAGYNSSVTASSAYLLSVYEAGFISLPSYCHGVVANGSYAYVADGASGLRIINIADPAAPVTAGFCNTPGIAYRLTIRDNYAYVADYNNGLRIIDISNPSAPVETGFVNIPGTAYDVALSGNYAYVAADIGYIRVINISNPAAPVETSHVSSTSNVLSVAVYGNFLYAGCTDELRIYDISNPAAPALVGGLYQSDGIRGIAVIGNYAYLAALSAGLRIVNIGNPAAPVETGHLVTPSWAYSVSIKGTKAYVAASSSGVRIIDITSPFYPYETGYFTVEDAATCLSLDGNHIYVTDEIYGLRIFRNEL